MSLSWPALPCLGPSWQGYYPKFGVIPPPPPPPTPQGNLRVVVAVDGFWVGVFVFLLLLTNSYQPNFEIPKGLMKTLYYFSIINIRLGLDNVSENKDIPAFYNMTKTKDRSSLHNMK